MNTSPFYHSQSSTNPWESSQLKDLLSLEVNRNLIAYIVHCTIETVDCALSRPATSTFRDCPRFCPIKYGPFVEFASRMIYRSRVKLPVLLVALVYIERARSHLSITVERWACERVFVGALVLAGKYLSDFAMKNVDWARWSSDFRPCHIGRMEREFLNLLDYELNVTEADLLVHHEFLVAKARKTNILYTSPTPSLGRPHKRARSDSTTSSQTSSSSCTSSSSSQATPFSSPTLVYPAHDSSSSTLTPSSSNTYAPKILHYEPPEIRLPKRQRLSSSPVSIPPHLTTIRIEPASPMALCYTKVPPLRRVVRA